MRSVQHRTDQAFRHFITSSLRRFASVAYSRSEAFEGVIGSEMTRSEHAIRSAVLPKRQLRSDGTGSETNATKISRKRKRPDTSARYSDRTTGEDNDPLFRIHAGRDSGGASLL
jgi:hypothetical protein